MIITGQTIKEGVVTDIMYRQKVMKTIDEKVDYLAQLFKIKSGVRSQAANNILNSIGASFVQDPNKDYSKSLESVKKTIEQLREEGKLSKVLEEKYNNVNEKIEENKNHPNDFIKEAGVCEISEYPKYQSIVHQVIDDVVPTILQDVSSIRTDITNNNSIEKGLTIGEYTCKLVFQKAK